MHKGSWIEEEDKILIQAHKDVGKKWAEIARRFICKHHQE
jgi:myb proto-oncogene protein